MICVCPVAFNNEQQTTSKTTEPNNNESKDMKKLMVISLALLIAGAVSVRAADAKENWEKHCAKCHGPDGKGKTKMGEKLGIKDYTDAKVQEEPEGRRHDQGHQGRGEGRGQDQDEGRSARR